MEFIRELVRETVETIIHRYNCSRGPYKIQLNITDNYCNICKKRIVSDLNIKYTNYIRKIGWVYCNSCNEYIEAFLKYRYPHSLTSYTNKYEGTKINYPILTKGGFIRINKCELGTALHKNPKYKVEMFSQSNCVGHFINSKDANMSIHGAFRKPRYFSRVHVQATISYLDNYNDKRSRRVWLCNLILFNRHIFGYNIRDSKILLGENKRWENQLIKEYKYANHITKVWETFILCSQKYNIYNVIYQNIFTFWFDIYKLIWSKGL